jgi:pimeloyl-ACP methyl ester carboxylesterase/DNA-binding CsgD family transcriptional regulator
MAMTMPGFSYTRSADGTSLAYMRLGTGPMLVLVPPVPLSSVGGDWGIPLMRDVYQRLATSFELVLYDGRGTGASQRSVDDLSTDAFVADLDAVLDAVGATEVTLLAMYLSCPAAVTYASRYPERVGHLVLYGAADHGARSFDRPGTAALLGLIDHDWELFTKTAALDWMGWGAGESGNLVAESLRTASNPTIAKAALVSYGASDLRPMLGTLRAETLVLHRRDGSHVPIEQSTELAAAMPEGRLHVLDGDSATLFFDDPGGTVDVIAAFARPGHTPLSHTGSRSPGEAALTDREAEVLTLIAAGESNAEIAHRLGLSVHTVERHAANIYRKIDARGRADATAWALRNGLG